MEYGMITNDKYPILGVSPDGILLDRLLEIKCPYSRIIDGTVQDDYYHQMMEQMFVCDYKQCDFFECSITAKLSQVDFYDVTGNKGIIILVLDINDTTSYVYSDNYKTNAEFDEWFMQYSNQIILHVDYYKVDGYNCQTITRDEEWINKYYPTLEKFWSEVCYYREHGYNSLQESLKPRCAF
jgi:hypothetical protein